MSKEPDVKKGSRSVPWRESEIPRFANYEEFKSASEHYHKNKLDPDKDHVLSRKFQKVYDMGVIYVGDSVYRFDDKKEEWVEIEANFASEEPPLTRSLTISKPKVFSLEIVNAGGKRNPKGRKIGKFIRKFKGYDKRMTGAGYYNFDDFYDDIEKCFAEWQDEYLPDHGMDYIFGPEHEFALENIEKIKRERKCPSETGEAPPGPEELPDEPLETTVTPSGTVPTREDWHHNEEGKQHPSIRIIAHHNKLIYAEKDPLGLLEKQEFDLDDIINEMFDYTEGWAEYKRENKDDLTKSVTVIRKGSDDIETIKNPQDVNLRQGDEIVSAPTLHPFHVALALREFKEAAEKAKEEKGPPLMGLVFARSKRHLEILQKLQEAEIIDAGMTLRTFDQLNPKYKEAISKRWAILAPKNHTFGTGLSGGATSTAVEAMLNPKSGLSEKGRQLVGKLTGVGRGESTFNAPDTNIMVPVLSGKPLKSVYWTAEDGFNLDKKGEPMGVPGAFATGAAVATSVLVEEVKIPEKRFNITILDAIPGLTGIVAAIADAFGLAEDTPVQEVLDFSLGTIKISGEKHIIIDYGAVLILPSPGHMDWDGGEFLSGREKVLYKRLGVNVDSGAKYDVSAGVIIPPGGGTPSEAPEEAPDEEEEGERTTKVTGESGWYSNLSEKQQASRLDPKEVYSALLNKGFPDIHAKGVLVNMLTESRFNPVAINKKGTKLCEDEEDPMQPYCRGLGLFQFYASRQKAMLEYYSDKYDIPEEESRLVIADEWEAQIDYALTESKTREYLSKKFKSVREAAAWFTKHWERSGGDIDKYWDLAQKTNLLGTLSVVQQPEPTEDEDVERKVGDKHPDYDNVIWGPATADSPEEWQPESGYEYTSDDRDDLSVKPVKDEDEARDKKVLIFGHSQAQATSLGGAIESTLKGQGIELERKGYPFDDSALEEYLKKVKEIDTFTHAILIIGGNSGFHQPGSQTRMIRHLLDSGIKSKNIYISTPPINIARVEKGIISKEKVAKYRIRNNKTRSLAISMGARVLQTIESNNKEDWHNSEKHGPGLNYHLRAQGPLAKALASDIASRIASGDKVNESKVLNYINQIIEEVMRGNMS